VAYSDQELKALFKELSAILQEMAKLHAESCEIECGLKNITDDLYERIRGLEAEIKRARELKPGTN